MWLTQRYIKISLCFIHCCDARAEHRRVKISFIRYFDTVLELS